MSNFHFDTRKNTDSCYITGETDWLELHHVYGGANRKLSDKYGCLCWLNHYVHNEPPNGVHHNKEMDLQLKRECQEWTQNKYGWTIKQFRSVFGKSYL